LTGYNYWGYSNTALSSPSLRFSMALLKAFMLERTIAAADAVADADGAADGAVIGAADSSQKTLEVLEAKEEAVEKGVMKESC
jgi:hypothetical protein